MSKKPIYITIGVIIILAIIIYSFQPDPTDPFGCKKKCNLDKIEKILEESSKDSQEPGMSPALYYPVLITPLSNEVLLGQPKSHNLYSQGYTTPPFYITSEGAFPIEDSIYKEDFNKLNFWNYEIECDPEYSTPRGGDLKKISCMPWEIEYEKVYIELSELLSEEELSMLSEIGYNPTSTEFFKTNNFNLGSKLYVGKEMIFFERLKDLSSMGYRNTVIRDIIIKKEDFQLPDELPTEVKYLTLAQIPLVREVHFVEEDDLIFIRIGGWSYGSADYEARQLSRLFDYQFN